MSKIITLDIETENTGYDIMKDNKRIISVQMLDNSGSRIFFDGSQNMGLEHAKKELTSLIDDGANFLGFNIRNFDTIFIKEFLKIEIPYSQIIEISEMPEMEKTRQQLGTRKPRLEEVCKAVGVDCTHKGDMNERAVRFKTLPEVIQKAKEGANKWQNELGWSGDFSYKLALDKISGGMAILDAFNEFVKSGGSKNSLFYQYAIRDVLTESRLYAVLNQK